jgi:hypothetical protein
MGVVYLATDRRLGRRVALKVIVPELAADAQFRQRVEREARLPATLEHPHIVPVYEAGEQDGSLFIAMRFKAHPGTRGRVPVSRPATDNSPQQPLASARAEPQPEHRQRRASAAQRRDPARDPGDAPTTMSSCLLPRPSRCSQQPAQHEHPVLRSRVLRARLVVDNRLTQPRQNTAKRGESPGVPQRPEPGPFAGRKRINRALPDWLPCRSPWVRLRSGASVGARADRLAMPLSSRAGPSLGRPAY